MSPFWSCSGRDCPGFLAVVGSCVGFQVDPEGKQEPTPPGNATLTPGIIGSTEYLPLSHSQFPPHWIPETQLLIHQHREHSLDQPGLQEDARRYLDLTIVTHQGKRDLGALTNFLCASVYVRVCVCKYVCLLPCPVLAH